jgi:hypothetical protein
MVWYEQVFYADTQKQEKVEKVVAALPRCQNSASGLAYGAKKGEALHGHRSGSLYRP